MNRLYFLIFALFLISTSVFSQVKESMYGDATKADIKVNYVFSFEEALKRAKNEHKLVFFNCFSDWALPCHSMNQHVFSNEEFGKWLNDNFVNLWIEMTTEEGLVLAKKYGVESMPYFLVLDANGDVIHRLASGTELPEFKERLMCALDPKTSYKGMNDRYAQGNRKKKFLREYTRILRWAGEKDNYNKMSDLYFGKLKSSEWCKKENWEIFADRMRRPDSVLIDYLFMHKADFVKNNGLEIVNNMILTLYYSDAMALAGGGKQYDKAMALDIYTQLRKADIPDTNEVYKFLDIASLRYAEKYKEMTDYLLKNITHIHPRVLEMIDLSLGSLQKLTPDARNIIIAYLEKRAVQVDEYSQKRYRRVIEKIRDFKGMIFEELSLDEALSKAKEEGKYVFLDCYTSWCGPCKMMESQVFSHELAGTFCNKYFVNIKIDMEKGEGPEVAERYQVEVYPTMLILNADGSVRCRIRGGRDVKDFMLILQRSMNDEYNYSTLVKEYNEGNRETSFLARYYLTMSDAGELKNADEVIKFLASLKGDERFTPETWFLYKLFASNVENEEFLFLIEHKQDFERVMGKATVEKAIQNIVFPVYVEYLLQGKGKEKVICCREIWKKCPLADDDVLKLLDIITFAYEQEDANQWMSIYENKVQFINNLQDKLNLDALLNVFVKNVSNDIQKRVLAYMQGAMKQTEGMMKAQYENLLNELSNYIKNE